MKELKLLPGKHFCGKEFDMRIVDAKDDNNDPVAWLVYGICKKCNIVLVSAMFLESDEPKLGIDFIVDYDKISEKGTEFK